MAFDATGGGKLAGQILTCMEAAALKMPWSSVASTVYKGLHLRRPGFTRNFGLADGGWLLTPFLQKIGAGGAQKLRERVAAEIKTTFASHYTKEVSLTEALQLEAVTAYGKQATGEKYLILPNKGLTTGP